MSDVNVSYELVGPLETTEGLIVVKEWKKGPGNN